MARLLSTLSAVSLLSAVASGQQLEVKAPAQVPDSASPPIDRSYLGFGFECTSWPAFAGDKANPNVLSRGLIENLTNKTGSPVIIRVGGTSQDHVVYDPNQKQAIKKVGPDAGLKTPNSLGPLWLEGFQQVPDAKYAFQVPLATNKQQQNVDFAKAAFQAIDAKNLDSFEIGNEPNFYTNNERGPDYNPARYDDEFASYSDAIQGATALPPGPQFQAGAIASDVRGWDAPDLFNAGLKTSNKVKSFSMHYYETFTGETLRSTLLNHRFTVQRTDNMFKRSIAYLRNKQPDVPFVLGEVGSSLAARAVIPESGALDRVLGSALWAVDWLLYTMSAGVARVNMQQGLDFNYAAWRPVSTPQGPRTVHAQYYGFALVADLLGLGAGANGDARLRVTSLWDEAHPNISPYAGYVNGKLDRYVIVDLNEWNATSTEPRGAGTVTLDVPEGVKCAELRRLTGPGANAGAADMTYAGTKYTVDRPNGEKVGPETEDVGVEGGKVDIKIQASEAVLVMLHR